MEVCNVIDVCITNDHGTYLGLPSLIGSNKKEIFFLILRKELGIAFKVGTQSLFGVRARRY